MDTLISTLKAIFSEQGVGEVINSLLVDIGYHRWIEFEKNDNEVEPFLTKFIRVSTNLTIDHARAAWRITADNYTKDSSLESSSRSQYCSIYNILVHFSEMVLGVADSEPICRFEHLLCWQDVTQCVGEDLITTSFLANRDVMEHSFRNNFSWPEYVSHDNQALNNLFENRMADVHNHLKGSGFSSELNWLSLMNDVIGRRQQFEDANFSISKAGHSIFSNSYSASSLYVRVMQAAAIRLWLFQECSFNRDNQNGCNGSAIITYQDVLAILKEDSDIGISTHLQDLRSKIDATNTFWGRKFPINDGTNKVVDYAILDIGELIASNPDDNINTILSGERFLLYHVFRRIYRCDDGYERLSVLLYVYLLIKNQFLSEVFQRNGTSGFANFSDYESRKEHFIKDGSIYKSLVIQTAIGSSLVDNRFLESRIAPDSTERKLAPKIKSYDKEATAIGPKAFSAGHPNSSQPQRWEYVAHFIKKKDRPNYESMLQQPQNWNVRKEVESQSKAIYNLRQHFPRIAQRIVGIDAANSELFCRPEVFAQAFRYLRVCHGNRWLGANPEDGMFGEQNPISDLKVTYHVGEDFYDIIDGLRAVREAMMFLEMRGGDRIGHGLVLGTDVAQYYKDRSYAIPMSQQCILDNMAFLLIEAYELDGFDKIKVWAEFQYEKYFRRIFKEVSNEWSKPPSPNTYYQSWLLRGDAPICYSNWRNERVENPVNRNDYLGSFSPWERACFVRGSIHDDARTNGDARRLYHYYHYNAKVKENGSKFDQIKFPIEAISVIERLQEKILRQVEGCHISIECNPSSNLKIGSMQRYIEHPIFKFYTLPSDRTHKPHHIRVSINTDDKSIFATSLEREFSLLAAACDKEFQHGNTEVTPREVYRWLDEIREMAFEMRFRDTLRAKINYFI